MNKRNNSSFLPGIANNLILPIDIRSLEASDIRLRSPQVPRELVKGFPLGVLLPLQDPAVLLPGDSPFLLILHCRPLALGDKRPWKPVHIDTKVVHAPKVNVGGDGPSFHRL